MCDVDNRKSIALQDVLIPKIDEKNFLGHEKGTNTICIDTKMAYLKKKELPPADRQINSSLILRHPPNSFLTQECNFKVLIEQVSPGVGNTTL